MAQVKAKRTVYLGHHGGLRQEGEVFDYEGPDHKHLEPLHQKTEDGPEDNGKGQKKTNKGS